MISWRSLEVATAASNGGRRKRQRPASKVSRPGREHRPDRDSRSLTQSVMLPRGVGYRAEPYHQCRLMDCRRVLL